MPRLNRLSTLTDGSHFPQPSPAGAQHAASGEPARSGSPEVSGSGPQFERRQGALTPLSALRAQFPRPGLCSCPLSSGILYFDIIRTSSWLLTACGPSFSRDLRHPECGALGAKHRTTCLTDEAEHAVGRRQGRPYCANLVQLRPIVVEMCAHWS